MISFEIRRWHLLLRSGASLQWTRKFEEAGS